ncbi:MAG: hypothetical protein DCC68_26350 [Planctomycetota bacterium]|nr:MAG: hypothetical protein DCC68_26350 [Planctomycetota bacterium]
MKCGAVHAALHRPRDWVGDGGIGFVAQFPQRVVGAAIRCDVGLAAVFEAGEGCVEVEEDLGVGYGRTRRSGQRLATSAIADNRNSAAPVLGGYKVVYTALGDQP